jgi:threonine aldolase
MTIDFRSDTVTKPTPGMLKAMLNAPVGDDVFEEDPSINRLEAMVASRFGMENAIFCPSGTMTNQIAIKCHTQPGDEVICDENAHIYRYEGGGMAFNSGCSVRLLRGDRGRIRTEQLVDAINPDDPHRPRSSLVALENTSNRGGGSCYSFQEIQRIRDFCNAKGLHLHLDGARLFNALVAKNESPEQYGAVFDSISICLSKSLGAPVGSLLIGKKEFIRKARRVRKVFGGGMRQAGYLAAAGIYALENHVERLAADHEHARLIANALCKKDFVEEIMPVETNIVLFSLKETRTPAEFVESMRSEKVLMFPISSKQVRIVVHLDISREMVNKTIDIIDRL